MHSVLPQTKELKRCARCVQRRVPVNAQPNRDGLGAHMTEEELQRHLEPFYPLVGRIVVDWAMIERALDEAAAIFRTVDPPDRKLSFRDRVGSLRTAFCSLATDLKERAFMDRLANEILDVADIRDVVANGTWSSFQEGPPFALTFSLAPLGREDGKLAELTVSAGDLENLLEKTAKLRSELVVFPFV